MRMDEDDNDDAMEVHSGRDYMTGLSSTLPFIMIKEYPL